jgi:hypothetical protein
LIKVLASYRKKIFLVAHGCLRNLVCEFACVDEPAYELKTAMSGQCKQPLSLVVFSAQLAQAIHLPLCKTTPAQNFTVFFAVHMKLLLDEH